MKLELKLKDGLKGIPVVKQYIYLVLFLFILNCSLNPNSKFWTEEKKILIDKKSTNVLFEDKKESLNEFNQNFKITLPKNLKVETNQQLNNDGFINFDSNLEKMSKYNSHLEVVIKLMFLLYHPFLIKQPVYDQTSH